MRVRTRKGRNSPLVWDTRNRITLSSKKSLCRGHGTGICPPPNLDLWLPLEQAWLGSHTLEGSTVTQDSPSTTSRLNRRSSRRSPLRGTVRIECRKGAHGLGPDLVKFPLDISETGVRLVLKVALAEGQEVEVLISGGHGKPLKRTGRIIWSVPTENNCHVVGLRFDGHLPFGELQGMTKPARPLS